MRTDPNTNHTQQHKQQIKSFRLQIAFTKDNGPKNKGNNNTTAPHHGYHGYQRPRQTQRIEISQVGRCQEKRDKHDAPPPPERRRAPSKRRPHNQQNDHIMKH